MDESEYRLDYDKYVEEPKAALTVDDYRKLTAELERDIDRRSYRTMSYLLSDRQEQQKDSEEEGGVSDELVRSLLNPLLLPADRMTVERARRAKAPV